MRVTAATLRRSVHSMMNAKLCGERNLSLNGISYAVSFLQGEHHNDIIIIIA